MKQYLCIEHGEHFFIEAEDLKEAQKQAQEWGGECIGEIINGRVIIDVETRE